MNKLLTLLFLLLLSLSRLAFSQEADSLERLLPTLRDSKEKVTALNHLSRILQIKNPQRALKHSMMSLELCIKNKYSREMIEVYLIQNYVYWGYGDYQNGLDVCFKALDELEKHKDKKEYKALYLETLQVVSVAYSSIGEISKANEYRIKTLKIAQQVKDTSILILTYINTGEDYRNQQAYSSALKYTQKALDLALITNDQVHVSFCNMNFAEIYIDQEKYLEAKKHLENAIPILYSSGDSLDYAYAVYLRGKIYHYDQDFSAAINHFNISLGISERLKAKRDVADYAKELSKSYEVLGNTKKALFYYTKYHEQNDLIYNEERLRQISTIKRGHLLHQKDLEIKAKRNELERSKYLRNSLITTLVLGGISAVTILMLLRKRNQERKRNNERLRRKNEETELQNMQIAQQSTLLGETNDKLEISNKELAGLNEDKNHLIGIVAHDLRGPLNQIEGLMNLLSMTSENFNEEQKQFVSMILSSVSKQKEMISQILDLRAIESQRVNMNIESINPNEIIEEAFQIFTKAALKKNIRLKTFFDDDYLIDVDRNYFTQIIDNLMSNAIKFSPKDKSVCIKTYRSKTGNKVQIEVSDEGFGIHEDEKDLLFKQFSKLSTRPTAGESSTGLGLSIVKKYVELMNGKVWCESEQGKGAKFFVRFNEIK